MSTLPRNPGPDFVAAITEDTSGRIFAEFSILDHSTSQWVTLRKSISQAVADTIRAAWRSGVDVHANVTLSNVPKDLIREEPTP